MVKVTVYGSINILTMAANKPPTKAEMRDELRRAMREFIARGGEVQRVQRGVSGREEASSSQRVFFDTPRQPRTPVANIIADIESRRKPKPRKNPAPARKKPRLKVIYDDFGEPVRRIWVDE